MQNKEKTWCRMKTCPDCGVKYELPKFRQNNKRCKFCQIEYRRMMVLERVKRRMRKNNKRK